MSSRIGHEVAAHDLWVCFDCRWTSKLPKVDVRVRDRPSYSCPKCNRRMRWCGTTFRPPRRGDDEAWEVAERLVGMGLLFVSTGRRQHIPRTMDELQRWLELRKAAESWSRERPVTIEKAAGGMWTVRSGRRCLADRELVLAWHRGDWHEGCLRVCGDGGKPLEVPVILVEPSRRVVALSARTRLRLRGRGTRLR